MLSSVLGFVAVMLSATFGITSITNSLMLANNDIQAQNRSVVASVLHPGSSRLNCAPQVLANEERVRGLAWGLKALPFSADRLSFNGQGAMVSYRVSASPVEVADFYLQQESCDTSVALLDGEVYITRVGESQPVTIRIASVERSAGVSSVQYELGVLQQAVLGESTVRLVQETTSAVVMNAPNESGEGNENTLKPFPPQPIIGGDTKMNPQDFMPFKPGESRREPPRMPFERREGERSGMSTDTFDGVSMKIQEAGVEGLRQDEERDQQQLKMMKQQMEKMKQEIARVKKQMESAKTKLKKACNLNLPEDVANALSSIDQLMAAVESANDTTDSELAIEDLRDAMQTIREGGMEIQRLFQMCEKLRRLTADLKRMDRESARLISQAEKSDNAGVNTLGQDLRSALTGLKDQLASVNAAATADDKEAAVDQVFETFESVNDAREALQLNLDVKKNLSKMKTELKRMELEIAKAAKSGKDVTEVKIAFEHLTTALKDLVALVQGTYTKEQLVEAVENIRMLRSELRDQIDELFGRTSEFEPTVKVNEQNILFTPSSAFVSGSGNQ